ncbi:hypothetical protein FOL46_003392 [Perkinsus olseni]|uniref:Uncharacterized protein n=1 Tax=Perkinsus olseni TaxID=32597 RepID=A0A7J6MTM1_PEROL|nr:hypothetical protein FOL46_003392 [Perkinsus olseni]
MGRWSSLRDLSLDHNNITCKGAHAVFTQLATAPIGGLSLETCDLSFNRVGDSGARRMALTLAQHNSSVGQGLRVLNLRGNRIGDWGAGWLSLVVRNLGAAGCSLEVLDVSKNPRITLSGGLAELSMACRQARQTLELDGVVLAVGLGGLTLKVSLERPRLHTEESFQSPLDGTEDTPVKVLKTSPSRGLIGLSEEHIGRSELVQTLHVFKPSHALPRPLSAGASRGEPLKERSGRPQSAPLSSGRSKVRSEQERLVGHARQAQSAKSSG